MKILLSLFRLLLQIIYLPMKLNKTKQNRVIFISRQSNDITLDFNLLIENLKKEKPNIDIIVLCKRFDNIKKHILNYSLYTLKTMYYLSTSKVCVIDSYCLPVSVLQHKKSLKVIQIWHSLGAIKKFGYQTLDTKYGRKSSIAKGLRMHKNYDLIISGSKAMTKYFSKAFGYEKKYFKEYGLPRIDYILNNKDTIRNKIYKKYPELRKKKNILYAPTFRKDDVTAIGNIVKEMDYKKYNFILKSHPNQEVETTNKNIYTCSDIKTIDLLEITDYLITDYSAISIEAAILDIKTFYYLFDYKKYQENNGINIDIKKEMPGCVYEDFKSLYKHLDSNEYNMQALKNYKTKFLPKKLGESTTNITKEILKNNKKRIK